MSYEITPLQGAMSIRGAHSTFDAKINTLLSTEKGYGSELYTAPADGTEVKQGDQWLHLTKAGSRVVDGWVAVVHKGIRYCNLTEIVDGTPPSAPDPVKRILKAVVTFERESGEIGTQELT